MCVDWGPRKEPAFTYLVGRGSRYSQSTLSRRHRPPDSSSASYQAIAFIVLTFWPLLVAFALPVAAVSVNFLVKHRVYGPEQVSGSVMAAGNLRTCYDMFDMLVQLSQLSRGAARAPRIRNVLLRPFFHVTANLHGHIRITCAPPKSLSVM